MSDLDELSRLEKEATPGPWEWEIHQEGEIREDNGYSLRGADSEIAHGGWGEEIYFRNPADARIIVAMRNALPEMIEELKNFMAIDEHDPFNQIAELKRQLYEARRAAAMWKAATTIPPPPAAIP